MVDLKPNPQPAKEKANRFHLISHAQANLAAAPLILFYYSQQCFQARRYLFPHPPCSGHAWSTAAARKDFGQTGEATGGNISEKLH